MSLPSSEGASPTWKALEPPRASPATYWEKVGLIVAGAFLLMRLFYLGLPNLFPEEAYYWNYAKHLDYGYLDHPPMVAWLIELGTRLFGDSEFGVRIFAFASSLVATYFVWRLTLLLYNRQAAILAVVLMQMLPIYFLTGFIMTPDAPLMACWAGALYFLVSVFFARRASAWWGVGICLGLGLLSKYTVALLGPSALLFMVWDRESRFWLQRIEPYVAAVLALLIFSPVIAWNQAHHWVSFAFQSANRVREPRRFSFHELLGSVLVLLTPLGAVAAGQVLAGKRRVASAKEPDLSEMTSERNREERRLLFVRVFTLLPLSVFVVFSLVHRVKLNWTGPLWLAVLPAVASLVATALKAPTKPLLRWSWLATFAACGTLYLGTLQHLSFGIPGLPYAENIDLLPVGWSTMGAQIEGEADQLRRSVPANTPVRIVGMDRNFIASEMAFYHSHPAQAALKTLGANLFGRPSLMYSYWFPSASEDGSTLLLVSFVPHSLDRLALQAHGHLSSAVKSHWLVLRGRKIRRYYTLALTDYHSVNEQR